MIRIDFPPPAFRTRSGPKGHPEIFDGIRRAWVRLSPEEWVRQNVISWMLITLRYPKGMIAVEKEIALGALKKKFDIMVFDRSHKPWMTIECKAMEVELTEDTLMQVIRYNLAVPARFLVITNGRHCHAVSLEGEAVSWLSSMPVYP